jgi:XTP/dITP diphosphohydrolase
MRIIVVATNNVAKFKEIKEIINRYGIIAQMPDIKIDVHEGVVSYEENARIKASYLTSKLGIDALGEDSGIEVPALGGFPGVISARFIDGSDNDRNAALLSKMVDIRSDDRKAVFKAYVVISLKNGGYLTGYGELKGMMTTTPEGSSGFGYDPIFIPDGYDKTLAQIPGEEKNKISHRRKAIEMVLKEYIKYET